MPAKKTPRTRQSTEANAHGGLTPNRSPNRTRNIAPTNPRHSRPSLGGSETLQIPILDFSLKTHFSELEGQSIAGFGDAATVELAYLDIRLRLDETGAEFVSFAEVGVVGDFGGDDEVVEYKPQRIRRLILNKPFFIAMQEKTGKQPWFMGWIANGELMESFVEFDASQRP